MANDRRLAAIMFTDIVGFTALMGEDEPKALLLLQKNRELLKRIIEQFHGRVARVLEPWEIKCFTAETGFRGYMLEFLQPAA